MFSFLKLSKTPLFIFLAGMESVQLRRMWLQSCCLVATTTEIRDQGKDPDTHKLNESCDLRSHFYIFVFIFPQIRRLLHVVTPPPLSLLIGHSLWVCPKMHLEGPTCAYHFWSPNLNPTDDHHWLEHKLPLSFLSLSHISHDNKIVHNLLLK